MVLKYVKIDKFPAMEISEFLAYKYTYSAKTSAIERICKFNDFWQIIRQFNCKPMTRN